MRSISTFGLVCLCGGAIAYVEQQGRAASPEKVVQAPAPIDNKQEVAEPKIAFADHPVRVLFEYLQPEGKLSKEILDCEAPIVTGERNVEVEALIATVVDPGRTRLSLALDRQFDAILKAARDSGYQFQDLWLPWRLTRAKEETFEQEETRERLPGLITFRNGNKLLTVWLVGETPTAGVSRAQFRQASCFMKRTTNVKFLGILGPTFSGTLASLQTAIDADLHFPPPNILSGTTTAAKAMTAFQKTFPSFASMIQNDDKARKLLDSFLEHQYRSEPRIVVLAESDTAFGNEVNAPDLIRYPREISRLRNAYQSDPKLAAQPENGNGEKRRQLLLPLHDSAEGQDTVPNFSLQTPISLETVLFQIAERLRNGRFDVAVLTGSNVLDTLFLGRFLALNVPDLRVVVFDSDLLFVHGTDSLDLIGTLSVSTFPLHPQLERAHDLFSSMSERALYEAGCRLLNCGNHANPRQIDSSPLWLSVVGRGNYWPVAILDGSAISSTLEIAAPTRVWSAVFWIATLVALCVAWLFLSMSPQRLGPAARSGAAVLYHPLSMVLFTAAYWALASNPVRLGTAQPGTDWAVQRNVGIVTLLALLLAAAIGMWRLKTTWWTVPIVAATSIFLVSAAGWQAFGNNPDQSDLFRTLRSVNLSSGVAPEVPLVFFLLSLAWWNWTNWRRMVLVAEHEVIEPSIDQLPRYLYHRILALLKRPIACDPLGWIVGAAAVLCVFANWRSLMSIETPSFDFLITLLLAANSAALLCTTLGFFSGWNRLRSYLKILHTHSSQCMDALAQSVHLQSFWTMGVEDNTFPMALEGLKVFKDIRYVHGKYAVISTNLENLDAALDAACRHVRKGERVPWDQTWQIREIPVTIAQQLRELRPHPPVVEASIAKAISLFHVAFIKYVLMQLRTLFSFLTVGFLLTACAMHSYPFQGAGFLRWWTGVLFVAPAVAVTIVWFQMEYDPILAKLSKQKEGLDLRSWERLASAGALPLIAGVSALFPQVGHFLFAWVHPTLSGLN